MKKIILSAAILLAALSFTACKQNKECWEVTIVTNMTIEGEKPSKMTTIQYIYCAEDELDAEIKQLQNSSYTMPGAKVTYDVTKKKVSKAQSECVGTTTDMSDFEF